MRLAASLAALLILFTGIVCLINGARRVGQPFAGFLLLENRLLVPAGRPAWGSEDAARISFAQLVGIESSAVEDASDIHSLIPTLPIGTRVTYRFQKEADVFTRALPTRIFGTAEYQGLYVAPFAAALCFLLAGWWALRRPAGAVTPRVAFFLFSVTVSVVLFTAGDQYGPYWFTAVYLAALCFLPATLLHLAISFPVPIGERTAWRRIALSVVYALSASTAAAFVLVRSEPSLFLPLRNSVHLLTANAVILYLARLTLGLASDRDPASRRAQRLALGGVLCSGLFAVVLFLVCPTLDSSVPPIVSLGFLPVFTAAALQAAPAAALAGRRSSVRLRLAPLFLGAVETAFLTGVAVFWLGDSRARLNEELDLLEQRQLRVRRFLAKSPGVHERQLFTIANVVQTSAEHALVSSAADALRRGEVAGARLAVSKLEDAYREQQVRLKSRQAWIGRVAGLLMLALIAGGVLQSIAFLAAVQRWLIRPIDRLTEATAIIATGDLNHRVELASEDELAHLAGSINTMASSLAHIQRSMDAERTARNEAAGAARDAERRRLARELHDGVLQDLGALKLRLEGDAKKLGAAQLQPTIDGIIATIIELRRVVDDLRPPDLTRDSLRDAIAAYAEARTGGDTVALQLDLPETIPVADWAARDIYRVVQEAITNALRHGSPRHLGIYFYERDGKSVLEVADDGSGFHPDRVVLGSGILGMRERAAAIGADLEITSAPAEGTMVQMILPAR